MEKIFKDKSGQVQTLDDLQPQEIDQIAKDYAERFVQLDRLKTHQLRNVFSAIEKMRSSCKKELVVSKTAGATVAYQKIETDLILLKPKIAYAAGRQRSVRANFFPLVEQAIDGVANARNKDTALRNFFSLMESVVGYHKFFESN